MSWLRSTAVRFRSRRAQSLVMFAIFLVALVLFAGLAIDLGFAYLTRASLSKAVDAACLTGVRTLPLGRSQAETLARASFAANYSQNALGVGLPSVGVAFETDTDGNLLVNVSATTSINTFFVRILPQWKTLTVSANGEATRVKVDMPLVLDRSGSMLANGGAAALPQAVSSFVDLFSEETDKVGVFSFASNARQDVLLKQPFKTDVKNAVNNWPAISQGRTFADGGLRLAYGAFTNGTVGGVSAAVRIVVFFTDGYANTFQDTFACSAPTNYNFAANDGPHDSPDSASKYGGAFLDPSTGSIITCPSDPNCGFSANLDARGAPPVCPITSFNSVDPSHPVKSVSWANVWSEGQLRALATATAMRTDPNLRVTIYAIGLGGSIDKAFLKTMANDKDTIPGSVYDPSQPSGSAVFAPTPGDLQSVFQTIASKILLRLTR